MNKDLVSINKRVLFYLFTFSLFASVLLPRVAISENDLLMEIIITYNQKALEKSFLDDSNRGEDGLLMMKPDVGKSLGMKVFLNQDFMDSREFYHEAEKALEAAEEALFSVKKEKVPIFRRAQRCTGKTAALTYDMLGFR